MDQYDYMRMSVKVYGKSIRKVVRETGHSRNTVRKAIRGVEPRYKLSKPKKKWVIDAVRHLIDLWLELDVKAPKKQQHTAKRIHERLVKEAGFKGSESAVRRYVAERKREMGAIQMEAMVPLDPEIGQQAEVDWGEAHVELSGVLVKVFLFCMRSVCSGKWFLRAYLGQAQEMFFDAHNRAFQHFGGVFPKVVYDNLKTAVKKVLRGKKREEQEQFILFRSHYGYQAIFCNPGKGNEKGGVEGLFSYARKRFMVPVPQMATLEDLNAHLLEAAQKDEDRVIQGREDRRTIAERAIEEQSCLLPLVPPRASHRIIHAKVDKYSCIRMNHHRYSVPVKYVGKQALVERDADEIRILIDRKQVATHRRSFDRVWCLDPLHYLPLIRQKVRSFSAARPIRAWQEQWPAAYHRLLADLQLGHGHDEGTRRFIDVLYLHQSYSFDEIETAIECAREQGTVHPDAIKAILRHLTQENTQPSAIPVELLPAKCRLARLEQPQNQRFEALNGAMR